MIGITIQCLLVTLNVLTCDACTDEETFHKLKCDNLPNYKKEIVDEHNRYRQLAASGGQLAGNGTVLPQAQVMPDLKWNTKLEQAAKDLVDTCVYGHDDPGSVGGFDYVGQNLFFKYTSDDNNTAPIFIAALASWYNEIKNFNGNTVGNFLGPGSSIHNEGDIYHFTQLIWANTTDVGCANSCFEDRRVNVTNKYKQIVACDYGPGGNFVGLPVYVPI